MKTKTWNIGEYARGGVISVEITSKEIAVIGREWDFNKGSKKSSNQKNSPEWTRETVGITDYNKFRTLDIFLNDLTSSYYADEILEWIKKNI